MPQVARRQDDVLPGVRILDLEVVAASLPRTVPVVQSVAFEYTILLPRVAEPLGNDLVLFRRLAGQLQEAVIVLTRNRA